MDYTATLCFCYAVTPFFAMAKEVLMNRRPWFTTVLVACGCAFAAVVTLVYFYYTISDSLCYSYSGVMRDLYRCANEMDYYTCCQQVEAGVVAGCGWNSSRAEFCTTFGDATVDYCSFDYCPIDQILRNISSIASPGPSNNNSLALT